VAVKQEEIEDVVVHFYKQLFSAQDELEPNLVLDHVPRKVTDDMTVHYCRGRENCALYGCAQSTGAGWLHNWLLPATLGLDGS
jgi:hypothetical protein